MTERYSQATFRQPRRDKLTPRIRDVVDAITCKMHTKTAMPWRYVTFNLDIFAPTYCAMVQNFVNNLFEAKISA